ncbi:MAG: glucan phosphoethanolaminetransferase (alkaline phosphatase superfamily) [Flavobacteriales bacterium]|jgi:glucan phosphoethanolaminetransferase (alkaline phosphatase superfamily)
MRKEFEEVDLLIKEALTSEEAKFYDHLDEQNMLQMFGGVFDGKNKWLIVIMNVMTFVALGFLIYCIVQFMNVEDTNMLIKWAAGGMICIMMMSMIKVFIWMQMDKNSVIRELTRLELQVSVLASKLSE